MASILTQYRNLYPIMDGVLDLSDYESVCAHRPILQLAFGLDRGDPRTLEEVGVLFDLTRERIRQIEARALSKLRHPSFDIGAKDLLSL